MKSTLTRQAVGHRTDLNCILHSDILNEGGENLGPEEVFQVMFMKSLTLVSSEHSHFTECSLLSHGDFLRAPWLTRRICCVLTWPLPCFGYLKTYNIWVVIAKKTYPTIIRQYPETVNTLAFNTGQRPGELSNFFGTPDGSIAIISVEYLSSCHRRGSHMTINDQPPLTFTLILFRKLALEVCVHVCLEDT